jgi:hypothetical protein
VGISVARQPEIATSILKEADVKKKRFTEEEIDAPLPLRVDR